VLLGEYGKGGHVDVTNSFAVPFEEQAATTDTAAAAATGDANTNQKEKESIFFFDHSYLASMYAMFKKVNARERVVGWYSTGRMRPSDLAIHDLVQPFCDGLEDGVVSAAASTLTTRPAVFVTCDVRPASAGLPFAAYSAVDEVRADGTDKASRAFASVPVRVGQTEAEAVGVEHLLRDVRDATLSELSSDVAGKLTSLQALSGRLEEVKLYLTAVLEGKLPVNHDILALLQSAYGLLPNLQAAPLGRALATQSNDMMAALYSASLVRSVLALHKLIDNKERRLWAERDKAAREAERVEKKRLAAKEVEKEKESKDAAEKASDK
jgi:26S proteasome regulatory subunit N8